MTQVVFSNPSLLDAGKQELAAKSPEAAIPLFRECMASADENEATECRWELGWAYWLLSDWEQVVEQWEAVRAVEPLKPDLDTYLGQARSHLALRALISKGGQGAPATYRSAEADGKTVRLRAVGDLMIGTSFPGGYLPPDDAVSTFDGVSDWLSDADITFGNLEGPICDDGVTRKCQPDAKPGSCYAFKSPTRYTQIYADAGFDLMSTANNHASDFGEECRAETERQLDAVGIAHSGRPGDVASMDVNGLRLAMIAFHTSRSGHYLNDHETAAALVRALSAEHDLVVVSFHGGAEGSKAIHVPDGREYFYGEDRGHLRQFTHTVVDAGADLVLGHGPHVLRGMEVYQERLIVYSLGNFATYGRFSLGGNLGVGAVLEVTLAADGAVISGLVLPTVQIGQGVPVKDPEGKAIDLIRHLSAQDFQNTAVLIAQDGQLVSP